MQARKRLEIECPKWLTCVESEMKKIAIALSALAGIVFLSGCAYDTFGDRYAYDYDRYAYNYDVVAPAPVHHMYFLGGVRYDCFYTFNARFCG